MEIRRRHGELGRARSGGRWCSRMCGKFGKGAGFEILEVMGSRCGLGRFGEGVGAGMSEVGMSNWCL